jgi:predicted RNA binding protein YcfA (HicA-like mRNA interferase family)
VKPISFRELRRRLLKAGFVEAAQSGSHIKFAKITSLGTVIAIVPKHQEVSPGTLRSVLRQAGISEKDFSKL